MKRILVLCSFLLPGCYSYFPLLEGERSGDLPDVGEDVVIVLSDSTGIESTAGCHVMLDQPSDVIVGKGQGLKRYPKVSFPFVGILPRASVDSTAILESNGERYFRCWLRDSTVILFHQGEYITVGPEQGAGFFCSGVQTRWGSYLRQFSGKIPLEKIQRYEVEKLSGVNTTFLGLAMVPVIGVLAAAVLACFSHGSSSIPSFDIPGW